MNTYNTLTSAVSNGITCVIQYEITDAFNGEANYSWVRRGKIYCKPGEKVSDLAAVRRVKKEIGWNGVDCRKENQGEDIALYLVGSCIVCFISFHYSGNASA